MNTIVHKPPSVWSSVTAAEQTRTEACMQGDMRKSVQMPCLRKETNPGKNPKSSEIVQVKNGYLGGKLGNAFQKFGIKFLIS